VGQTPGPSPAASSAAGRHPIFDRFRPHAEPGDGRFWTDWLGVRARRSFHAHYDEGNGVGYLRPHVQPVGSEYFEWLSLLCAAAAAEPPFTMFELGSGWGRWLLRGALACRQLGKDFRLAGVEAEPKHFEWMKTAFGDNDIDPDRHLLVNCAVGGGAGEGWFISGNSREWYGQSLLAPDQLGWGAKEAALVGADQSGDLAELRREVSKVRVVPLRDLLEKFPRVHLLNMDIQNAEADVVEGSAGPIDARVELAHVSTHSPEVERRLRAVFARLGWVKLFDFDCQGQRSTPYGEVGFVDGVQTWLNPTADHVLDWLCDPSILRFVATQNCLLQQKWQQAQDLHALEVRAVEGRVADAMRDREEAEALLVAARLRRERRKEPAVRKLARHFPTVARGVKFILRPIRGRKSA
jgi:FkbM family methyltransferase